MIPVLFLQMLAEQKQPYESVKQVNSFHNISQGKVYKKSHTGWVLNNKREDYDHKNFNMDSAFCGREMMNQLSHFGNERKSM